MHSLTTACNMVPYEGVVVVVLHKLNTTSMMHHPNASTYEYVRYNHSYIIYISYIPVYVY